MFSATWPTSVRRLAADFMTAPLRITVGSDSLTANSRVEQVAIVVEDGRQKETLLLAHLRDNGFSLNAAKKKGAGEGKDRDKALVFALYKKEATRLFEFLQRKGYEVGCINGDMSQDKRTQSLNDFKTGKVNILVATGASLFSEPKFSSTELLTATGWETCLSRCRRSWSRYSEGRARHQPNLPSHH
jgi:ATP-dependent RNA helicase DBP3